MSQAQRHTQQAETRQVNSQIRVIRLTPNDNNEFSSIASKHVSNWNIHVSDHFQTTKPATLTQPEDHQTEELTGFNWIITFFLLAVTAAVLGFSGLAGTFSHTVQITALGFVALLIASLIYNVITANFYIGRFLKK